MDKNLIFIGGGGHSKSLLEVAESAGYSVLGILDRPENVGKRVRGYQIVGTDDDIPLYVGKAEFLITVGFIKNPSLRIELFKKVLEAGGKFAIIVASTAYVSKYATLGVGTVIMHQAFVNAGAVIGDNVIINTLANIEHDVRIGNQCHISTGAMINGDCIVGDNCFIGSQSVLANSISICSDVVVGAGSLVRKSIKQSGIYSGNPAILKIKK